MWLANELGTDTIEGFNYGEDKIDLIDLLGLQSDQSLESYLSFNFDGGNTRISIDTNGDGNSNQDIILSGTDLSDKDNQTIINTLFTKVDESEPLFSSNSVEETPPSLSDLDDDSVI
ncbi:MAG: type I secretion C-terminal target domain-containing protein [Psychrobium sp.]